MWIVLIVCKLKGCSCSHNSKCRLNHSSTRNDLYASVSVCRFWNLLFPLGNQKWWSICVEVFSSSSLFLGFVSLWNFDCMLQNYMYNRRKCCWNEGKERRKLIWWVVCFEFLLFCGVGLSKFWNSLNAGGGWDDWWGIIVCKVCDRFWLFVEICFQCLECELVKGWFLNLVLVCEGNQRSLKFLWYWRYKEGQVLWWGHKAQVRWLCYVCCCNKVKISRNGRHQSQRGNISRVLLLCVHIRCVIFSFLRNKRAIE